MLPPPPFSPGGVRDSVLGGEIAFLSIQEPFPIHATFLFGALQCVSMCLYVRGEKGGERRPGERNRAVSGWNLQTRASQMPKGAPPCPFKANQRRFQQTSVKWEQPTLCDGFYNFFQNSGIRIFKMSFCEIRMTSNLFLFLLTWKNENLAILDLFPPMGFGIFSSEMYQSGETPKS